MNFDLGTWIRARLGLLDKCADSQVIAKINQVCYSAYGFDEYIAASKCNDLTGRVARQSHELERWSRIMGADDPEDAVRQDASGQVAAVLDARLETIRKLKAVLTDLLEIQDCEHECWCDDGPTCECCRARELLGVKTVTKIVDEQPAVRVTLRCDAMTACGVLIPKGEILGYLGHLVGGMISVRYKDRDFVIHPACTEELK